MGYRLITGGGLIMPMVAFDAVLPRQQEQGVVEIRADKARKALSQSLLALARMALLLRFGCGPAGGFSCQKLSKT